MSISTEFLDHIAIAAKDPDKSADWYAKVLGLKKIQPEEWKPYPIFMTAKNGSGLALFLAREPNLKGTAYKHIAFRIELYEIQEARVVLKSMDISFSEQDHIYFKSIYFEDPDGNLLELTAEIKPLPLD